jgi:hypothetical protein
VGVWGVWLTSDGVLRADYIGRGLLQRGSSETRSSVNDLVPFMPELVKHELAAHVIPGVAVQGSQRTGLPICITMVAGKGCQV